MHDTCHRSWACRKILECYVPNPGCRGVSAPSDYSRTQDDTAPTIRKLAVATPEEKNAWGVLAPAMKVSAWKKHNSWAQTGLTASPNHRRPGSAIPICAERGENKRSLANSINNLHEAQSEPP